MKISKLLVLSALCLFGINVQAADLIERTEPLVVDVVPTAVAFEADHQYLLYNTGAGYFFSQGNAWGTKASGNPNQEAALRVNFVKNVVNGEWDGKTYIFKIYSSIRSTTYSWHECFFDSETTMFVDRGSQANLYWEVIDKGNNTYWLGAAAANPSIHSGDSLYVGWDETVPQDAANLSDVYDNANAWPLHPKTNKNIEWQFYDASIFDVYDKAQELKALIAEAEEKGVNVDAAVAVYNDSSATLAQLEAALEALNKAMTDNTFAGFTPGTALDVSSLITNPDFKGNDLATGWSGTGFGSYGPKENAEHYNKTYDTYQKVAGLRPGLYVAGVNAFYRAGNSATAFTNFQAQNDDSKNAKFYVTIDGETLTTDIMSPYQGAPTAAQGKGSESSAKDEATGITYYIPNNMVAAEYYMHTLGMYNNTIFAEVAGSELTIGVKKEKTVTDDWSIFDDFSLVYCGEGAEGYSAYVNYYKKNMFTLVHNEYNTDDVANMGDKNYTKSYADAFNALSVTAGSAEEALAAIANLENSEAAKALRENIALWAEYMAAVKKCYNTSLETGLDVLYTEELGEWVAYDAIEDWNAQELTNEELRAQIDEWLAKEKEAWNHPLEGQEIDMTSLLTNPGFESGKTGWTQEAVSGGNVATGGTSTNTCYEAWNNGGFDIYQVVKKAPAGIYRIEVQGFYRYGRGQFAAYEDQVADEVKPGGAPVFVYMNAKATPFTNVYGDPQQVTELSFYEGTDYGTETSKDGTTYYFPNGMSSAAAAFSQGMYKQSAYGIIKEGDDMRIGTKGVSNQLGDSWCIWDNFKLYNCGKNADAVMNVLPDEITVAEGLLGQLMGKSVYEGLKKAVDAAKAAIAAGDDGNGSLFNALSDLFAAEENVNASVKKFNQLSAAVQDLEDALGEFEATATKAAADAAVALIDELRNGMANRDYEDADVDALLERIKAAKFNLRMPADLPNASDANPVEMTALIDNATYDENGNYWTCAAGAGWGSETAEVYNKTYDYYQDFNNMPEGVYEVGVRAFYRAGNAAADYSRRDSLDYNNAFLYGTTINEQGDSVTGSKAITRLVSTYMAIKGEDVWDYVNELTDFAVAATDTIAPAVKDEETGEEITPAEVKYVLVPNMMNTASTMLIEDMAENNGTDAFLNRGVFVRVSSNGKLRIGLMKKRAVANDWTLFDSWQLWYYGKDSQKELTADPSAIKSVGELLTAVRTEFFTIDGRKASAATRGLVIEKTTLSNGAVIVRKIRK